MEGKLPLQMVAWHVDRQKLGIGLRVYLEFWDNQEERVTKKYLGAKAVNDIKLLS